MIRYGVWLKGLVLLLAIGTTTIACSQDLTGQIDGRRILKAEYYDLLWKPTTRKSPQGFQVGLSWFLGEYEGHRIVFHEGGDTGFRSFILLLPDDGIGIVLASNWEQTDTGNLVKGILNHLLASGGR